VIVIAHRLQVHQQRRVAVEAKRGRGQQRSLQAVSLALAQNPLRRPRRIPVLVRQCIKKLLNAHRCLQRAQLAQILRGQAEGLAPVSPSSVFRSFLILQSQGRNPFLKVSGIIQKRVLNQSTAGIGTATLC